MLDPQLSDDNQITKRTLRQFAGLTLVIFGGLACWNGIVHDHAVWGAIFGGIALLVGTVGLASPETIRPLYSGLIVLTMPIGKVVSLVLLGSVFYLMFLPLGLVFRLIGRDPLDVTRPDRPTHWLKKPPLTSLRDYLRQS